MTITRCDFFASDERSAKMTRSFPGAHQDPLNPHPFSFLLSPSDLCPEIPVSISRMCSIAWQTVVPRATVSVEPLSFENGDK
jgi:hypothetical protein